MIRWARVTRAGKDDKGWPIQQFGYLGKTADMVVWGHYGFHCLLPVDTLAVFLAIGGNREDRIALPGSPRERPRLDVPGELVYFHPITGTEIRFKDEGELVINVTSGAEITVTADRTTVNGIVDVVGAVNLTGAVNMTGAVTITGPLDVSGTLDVVGATTLGSTVTSGSKNISDTHTHGGGPQPD